MVITLCGSARFERLFKATELALTLCGHAVFGLARYPSDEGGDKDWYDEGTKAALDEAHKRKIDASDVVVVLNFCAYIGESTLGEVEYARARGKDVRFLESWGEGLGLPHKDANAGRAPWERGATAYAYVHDQLAADGFGSSPRSPIRTVSDRGMNGELLASDLFGPAGATRSRAVSLINDAKYTVPSAAGRRP